MKSESTVFDGFSTDAFKFLKDLEKNNSVQWFAKNRNRYESYIVAPAKLFVESIGQFFNQLNPSIRTAPKFNETLMRMNKDMRFNKGEPYRTFFLIHFGRFKMDSEFYVYLDKNGISYGIFFNNSGGDNLYFKKNSEKYSDEITALFSKYKIDGKYNLFSFEKDPCLLHPKFRADKYFEEVKKLKFILLEKAVDLEDKLIYSPNLITKSIKAFSALYPIYCFAISPNPLKLLNDFEENFGTAV